MDPYKIPAEVNTMEVFYQLPCVKFTYVVPVGLRELMSDISREVLRNLPTHVYSFIADYLESLIVTRENIKVATRFVDDVVNSGQFIADLSRTTGTSPKFIIGRVIVIQRYFRNYLRKKYFYKEDEETCSQMLIKCLGQLKVSRRRANLAAIVIQRAYKQYKAIIEKLETAPTNVVNWRLAARNTFRIYSKTKGLEFWELNNAATKIQAAYKGYYERRKIRAFNDQEETDNDLSGLIDCTPLPENRPTRKLKEIQPAHENIETDSTHPTEEPTDETTDHHARKIIDSDKTKKDIVETAPVDTSKVTTRHVVNTDDGLEENMNYLNASDSFRVQSDVEDLHHNTRVNLQDDLEDNRKTTSKDG